MLTGDPLAPALGYDEALAAGLIEDRLAPVPPPPPAAKAAAPDARPNTPTAPTGGAAVLDQVADYLSTYVCFPADAALVASTLWAAHCHVHHVFDSTPRLALLSPEPGSGKTRALEVLELLVPEPMHVLSASVPAIFRSIEVRHPTLLFDEVDAVFGRHGRGDENEDLRGLLNAGHRNGATIPRCVGPNHDVKMFPVFGPVALAGLGDLPDTLMSRSVVIRMRRRGPGEEVRPFRRRMAEPAGADLRDRLADWTADAADQMADAWPEMPEGVTDRPADVWEPLLAVADAAGGHWPSTARDACVELVKVATNRDASLGVRLLTDLRAVFGAADHLFTSTLLDRLHKLEEAPWSDLRGKPLDSRGLARRLGEYGVHSKKVRIGEDTRQGYDRSDLWDAWQRYCPAPQEAEHPEQAPRVPDVPDVPHLEGGA